MRKQSKTVQGGKTDTERRKRQSEPVSAHRSKRGKPNGSRLTNEEIRIPHQGAELRRSALANLMHEGGVIRRKVGCREFN